MRDESSQKYTSGVLSMCHVSLYIYIRAAAYEKVSMWASVIEDCDQGNLHSDEIHLPPGGVF